MYAVTTYLKYPPSMNSSSGKLIERRSTEQSPCCFGHWISTLGVVNAGAVLTTSSTGRAAKAHVSGGKLGEFRAERAGGQAGGSVRPKGPV